jgi:predicted Zn-dependent protease
MTTTPTSRRFRFAGLACLALCLGVGCAPPFPTGRDWPEPRQGGYRRPVGKGPGGRSQPLALSPKQELEVGRRAYAELMEEFRGRLLPQDSPTVARARRIVERLAKAVSIEPLQREINLRLTGYRFEWEVNVIRDNQVNAFCVPAGKIGLFTGILKVAGDSDDYLATVLSHEMSHALAHHASERVARENTPQGILRSLSYAREQEAEADHIGVFLMAFAGYDPREAAGFWQRMLRARGGRGGLPEFLSDHPSDESRIRTLREWAPHALAAKEAYRTGRIAPSVGN